MRLIERSEHIRTLQSRYDAVRNGAGHVIFLGGEAGAGKTSLVQHFIAEIQTSALIFSGSCDSLFTPRPLGPLYDVAGQIGNNFIDHLKREKDRALIFALFVKYLNDSILPVVLVIEDVHWADEATLDFIKFISRRIHQFRCLLLITYRDDEIVAQHQLAGMFGQIPPHTFSKLNVGPLSREGVIELALAKSNRSGEEVFALTEGNAFYVNEILATIDKGVPERVKDSVLAVFHSKNERIRSLWEILSILPSRIDFNVARAMDKEFAGGIDDAIDSGVIVNRKEYLSFKHELYRIAIEGSLSAYRRKSLHVKMLAMLLADGVDDDNTAQLLHHARLAEDHTTIATIAPGAARKAAAMGAHIEASRLYLAAIQTTSPEDPNLVHLYEGHSYECYLTNQIKAAIASQERVVSIWQLRKDPLKMGDAFRFLSRVWWYSGNRSKATHFAKEAIDILENGFPTRERAFAYSNMAQLGMLTDNIEQTLIWGNQAIELASRLHDHEIACHALNNIGSVLMRFSDTFNEGEEKLRRSLTMALEHNLQEHAARAFTNLSFAYILTKSFKKAAATLSDGLKYCDEHDLNTWTVYMLSEKVKLLFETGAWEEAEALSGPIIANSLHPSIVRIGVIAVISKLKTRQGHFSEARTLMAEGKPLANATGEPQRIVPILSAACELSWTTGAALPENELTSAMQNIFSHKMNSWHYAELVCWMHRGGITFGAVPEIKSLEPFHTEVSGNMEVASEKWKALGCDYEAALALANSDEARQKSVIIILDAMGAPASADVIRKKLQTKGARNIPRGLRESTRGNVAHLTVRQIEVLRLLSDGLQNKEIADMLFISPKTVDHHISAIFSQLDVNTRAKAVIEAQRRKII